jgi:hypothetical protein
MASLVTSPITKDNIMEKLQKGRALTKNMIKKFIKPELSTGEVRVNIPQED